jgi:hypothetical protein
VEVAAFAGGIKQSESSIAIAMLKEKRRIFWPMVIFSFRLDLT